MANTPCSIRARVFALDKQGRLRAEIYDAIAEAVLGLGARLLAE